MILFALEPSEPFPVAPGARVVYLQQSSWDDYGFGTTFSLSVWVGSEYVPIGVTKIGRRGMISSGPYGPKTLGTPLDRFFPALDEQYFSVGQDIQFYANLVEVCGYEVAVEVLNGLRDLAVLEVDLESLLVEDVIRKSLLRSVSLPTIQDQFRRFLEGGKARQKFTLTYFFELDNQETSPKMEFKVDPERFLPSNVHVIIGANGVGKTTLLRNLRHALDDSDPSQFEPGRCVLSDNGRLSALVSVSFSAFDVFEAEQRSDEAQAGFRVTNVRLPWHPANTNDATMAESQQSSFRKLIEDCLSDRRERLLAVFSLLADADLVLANHGINREESLLQIDYSMLSSGHKIVLLALANIVRFCDEKTLVLVDEPESHLHPPLLGAFTSALSLLMSETNGLAVVATHSPVVLQEVTSDCAWCLWNYDGTVGAANPVIPTFGENVGLLTREVFGLELSRSGYHRKLAEVASRSASYDEALKAFDGDLGDEARLILRSLMMRVPST